MLASAWVQPRLGPLLRGGINLPAYHRQILLWGLFRALPGDVRGLKKIYLEATTQPLPEPEDLVSLPKDLPREGRFVFYGDNGFFHPLLGYETFLLKQLREITLPVWLHQVDRVQSVPIGINVRLAKDFPAATPKDLLCPTGPVRTPIAWFVQALKAVRSEAGFPVKAYVVSDGSESDLQELLALGNIAFLRPGCAISDLLVLSKSRILLASGGSSFSAWASFLGRMPTISFPGQSLAWFRLGKSKPYVGEFDPGKPSQIFLSQVKQALHDAHAPK